MALLEMFDGEVARGRERILDLPGYEEARMLEALERHYYTLAAHPTDTELSRRVVGTLVPLFAPDESPVPTTPSASSSTSSASR